MIMYILRGVLVSGLEGVKLYCYIVDFVIGCMFMTKAAHGGTLIGNCLKSRCSVFGWA